MSDSNEKTADVQVVVPEVKMEVTWKQYPPQIKSLVEKVCSIILDTEDQLKKTGKNKGKGEEGGQGGFAYVEETELMKVVRGKFAKQKIWMTTSVKTHVHQEMKRDGYQGQVKTIPMDKVETVHEWIDGDTGFAICLNSVGLGLDHGDKGSNKANTGAVKYNVLKNLMMSAGDDGEKDHGNNNDHNERDYDNKYNNVNNARNAPPTRGSQQNRPNGKAPVKGAPKSRLEEPEHVVGSDVKPEEKIPVPKNRKEFEDTVQMLLDKEKFKTEVYLESLKGWYPEMVDSKTTSIAELSDDMLTNTIAFWPKICTMLKKQAN